MRSRPAQRTQRLVLDLHDRGELVSEAVVELLDGGRGDLVLVKQVRQADGHPPRARQLLALAVRVAALSGGRRAPRALHRVQPLVGAGEDRVLARAVGGPLGDAV